MDACGEVSVGAVTGRKMEGLSFEWDADTSIRHDCRVGGEVPRLTLFARDDDPDRIADSVRQY